jgi:hypothetical protein
VVESGENPWMIGSTLEISFSSVGPRLGVFGGVGVVGCELSEASTLRVRSEMRELYSCALCVCKRIG